MARKSEIVTITEDNRDRGKAFLITEMPASRAEAWATRALLALAKSGADIPEDALNTGMAGIALAGVRALGGLSWQDVQPLMDEMFGCVQIIPSPETPSVVRVLLDDDIEEVSTRMLLREKVLSLHLGFSVAGRFSQSRQPQPATATEAISNT